LHLIGNPDFWWAFLAVKDEYPPLVDVYFVLLEHKPQSVLTNKKLVLQLCAYDAWIYRALGDDHPLKCDEDIVEVVLHMSPLLLLSTSLPMKIQLLYPWLVGQALARLPLCKKGIRDLYIARMADDLWAFRGVALGWAKGGGDMHDKIPQELLDNDDEIFCAFKGNNLPTDYPSLVVSAARASNKAFMTSLLEKNPTAVDSVADNLKGDVDLGISALSGVDGLVVFYFDEGFIPDGEDTLACRTSRFWFEVAGVLREKLLLRDVFVKLVLPSIHFSETKPSNLATLDQDNATTLALKQRIAEYAGVPIGKELGKLNRARKPLALFGIQFGLPKC